MVALSILQNMPIFGGINAKLLKLILSISPFISIKKDDYIFRECDPGGSMFVILEGAVAIERIWNDQVYILRMLKKGDCFGEMALIDLAPRSASVRVLSDGEAIRIDSSTLMKIYQEDIEQFTLIQMNMGREVSRRLRIADQRIFELTQTESH
jgi:CRP/FNR family transcriptional regulator, cyclic AMP receptor protein